MAYDRSRRMAELRAEGHGIHGASRIIDREALEHDIEAIEDIADVRNVLSTLLHLVRKT